MAKTPAPPPPVAVAVIGLPSAQNDRKGSGKSCICDRFLHPSPDEYTGEHSVVLTQQDYTNPVVNSTNFLYWGYQDLNTGGADDEGGASGGGGTPCRLHLIEHTEFIDSDKGQPFHCAQPYMKRVCNTKVLSKGKVAYISFEQLSLPESRPDAPKLPDRLAVDAFILCIDASADFSDSSFQKQFVNRLLPELVKTRKPFVVAITKCDLASPEAIKVVSDFASKQKKPPPVVEVCALHSINVSAVVHLAAHYGNQKFGIPKPKTPSFADEKKVRNEQITAAKDNLIVLLKDVAREFHMKQADVLKLVGMTPEGKEFIRLQGTKTTKSVIRNHLSGLRTAKEAERQAELLKKLHEVLKLCVPTLEASPEGEPPDLPVEDDKERLLKLVRSHEKFESFFLDDGEGQKSSHLSLSHTSASSFKGFSKMWCTDAVLKKEEEKIPWSFLMTKETEKLLADYTAEAKQRSLDGKVLARISEALHSCQVEILPGTPMEEIFQLAGCTADGERVHDRQDLQKMYNAFMRNLEVKYGKLLQEVFLEHPELFVLEERVSDVDALRASQERIKEIHEALKDNECYKLLDGRASFRQGVLMKHSALFLTKQGTLMEDPAQSTLAESAFRVQDLATNPSDDRDHDLLWVLDPNDAYLNLALVGQRDNIGKLRQDVKSQCSNSGSLEIGNRFCYPNMELFEYVEFENDIATKFQPQGAVFLIDSQESLKWLDRVVQRMCVISENHQLQPLVGMPLVILALGEEFMNENSAEVRHVTEVANRLQCGLLCEHKSAIPARLLHPPAAAQLLKLLVMCVDKTTQIMQPVFTPGLADLSISLCSLPSDSYNMVDMLGVWLYQPLSWYHDKEQQQVLQAFLWERATFVHIALKSHSLINTSSIRPTDSSPTTHGYVLVYSTARRASFANAKHLILKVLHPVPTLLVGVPPSATDKGQPELINEGRMLADKKENVRFIFADKENWKPGCLHSFYLHCWDRRFSSAQMQRPAKQKLSTRDLPQLPERDARSVSPAKALPEVPLQKAKNSSQRHSMQFGAPLPLPHSVAPPREEDTAQIQPASDSDEEAEVKPAAEIGDEMVKIELPSGGYHIVARSPRRASQENPATLYEDDDKMYMVPFQGTDSLKPNPSMLVNFKSAGLPRSASMHNQQLCSQIVDSDYSEPINSLRMSPRGGRKFKEGEPVPPSSSPTKQGSVENLYAPVLKSSKKSPQQQPEGAALLSPSSPAADGETAAALYAPVIKQPKKVPPEPPVRNASLGKEQELMCAVPDKPKPKGAPPNPPARKSSLEKEKEKEVLYAVPDKQKPKTAPKPPVRHTSVGEPEQEVLYAIPDRSKPKGLPPPIVHEKPKLGAAQKSPSSSAPIIARPVPEAESSPSPRTKKRGLFKWRGAKSKDDVLAADAPLPSSSISSSLAQEVAHKAKSLPRDNLRHLEKHQDQHAFDASDANGHVYDGHDREPDIDTPEIPSRVYLSDDAEDDTPEIPPREYNWSDLESDGDDDDDDDAGESEVMLQKVYDSLAKFGGPSKETEKLYDTLEQYQKVILARKQSVQQSSGADSSSGYHEVRHSSGMEPLEESQAVGGSSPSYDIYETVQEARESMKTAPPSGPAPPPPTQAAEEAIVNNLSDKEMKQRLKLMKRAAKEMERQQRVEKKKEKREEEQRRKEEERQKKKAMKSSMKRKGPQKTKAIPQKKSYFSSDLADITTESNPLPVFVVRCVEVVDRDGLDVEGIYRLSGKQDEVVELHCKFDQDPNLDVSSLDYDVTTISSALKAFFKLLPNPLFPDDSTQAVLSIFASEDNGKREEILVQVLLKMPRVNLKILAYLCQHLHRISLQSSVNRMSSSNLAIVFWPTLMRPPIVDLANPSQQLKWQKVMTTLIDKPDIIPDPDLEGAD